MTPNSPRIAGLSISIVIAVLFVAPAAVAQTPAGLTGVYNGTYRCGQGTTNLKLSLTVTAGGELSGLFTFYLPPGTQNQGYTYSLHGLYDARTAKFSLMPVRWETQHPANFTMVGMNGSFDSNELTGSITGAGCTTFNVERNQSESANIAAVMALQKSVAPADTGAAPAQGSYEAALRAQAPASARAALQATPPQPQPAPQAARSRTPNPNPQPTAPPTQAAAPARPAPAQNATIKNLCYSTDSSATAAYFSEIFDLPDKGSTELNFIPYELAKVNFQIYLRDTYNYDPHIDNPVNCGYLNSATTPNVAAAMAAQKQRLQAQAVAAGKQIVETGWSNPETPKASAATATPSRAASQSTARAAAANSQSGATRGRTTPSPDTQRAADDGARSARGLGQAERDLDREFAKVTSPIMAWGMKSEKDALTDEVTTTPTSMRFVPGADGKLQGAVTGRAYCGNNGVSIFFQVSADPAPSFPWYSDSSRDDDLVADVRIRVDDHPVHMAQGFPQMNGRQQYTNTMGLLFYEPGTFQRAVRDQQDSVTTGIPAFDGLLGGIVRQSAQANAQAWQDSAAGPLTDLVSARSIRIELPVTTFDPKPIMDLNPQDPVLHKFVSDCNARFAGGRR